jgi:hypothetical protein
LQRIYIRGIPFALLLVLFWPLKSVSQTIIKGTVQIRTSKTALEGVEISLDSTKAFTYSDYSGNFSLETIYRGEGVLILKYNGYRTQKLPVFITEQEIELGTLFMEPDVQTQDAKNIVSLNINEVEDELATQLNLGFLQATRDIFLTRAAFDFGQTFFKIRGYDAKEGQFLLNGIPLNKIFDGRPQWNNWGGLNDVTRNQEFSFGVEPSHQFFGGLLGVTQTNTSPTELRPGSRITASLSNRTYTSRLMVSHNSGFINEKWAYMFSASARYAREGYIDATLYDAKSFYGSFEYYFNKKNKFLFTGIYTKNNRGRSSAITEEVYGLKGKKYNPYWGYQNNRIRNSRTRLIEEPLVMLNYVHFGRHLQLNFGALHQFGSIDKHRLGYYNAPNPDPSYYRYLPSYHLNSSIGANYLNAELAKESFLSHSQIQWEQLYKANNSLENEGRASYLLINDRAKEKRFVLNIQGTHRGLKAFETDFGVTYQKSMINNFAVIEDLLGADYALDVDAFSETRNDLNGVIEKGLGEPYNYHYNLSSDAFKSFIQFRRNKGKWKSSAAIEWGFTIYQRNGLFKNERFANNSLGVSQKKQFKRGSAKTSIQYAITGRHFMKMNAMVFKREPVLQNVFTNPRENNLIGRGITEEKGHTVDVGYYWRLPNFKGRATGFYSRIMDATDINYFFVESGLGSDFVQETLSGVDYLHRGVEFGAEYKLSPVVKLNFVLNLGRFTYASDPEVTINFDTSGDTEDIINYTGFQELGTAKIKNLRLATGPQTAAALGFEYRDPKYWWIGTSANYFTERYIQLATVPRTESFLLDPETGNEFSGATPENLDKLLAQKPLGELYLLNFIGGKSWLVNEKYISVFASINNVFNQDFATGGYEQSRNGNYGKMYQDNLSGNPSFAPKYWYGYGRTFFINLSYSF